MLMAAKNNMRFLLNAIICNFKSSIEYRKSFIIQVVFMMINNGFFLIFWSVVFGINNNNIKGLEMNDIIYLWSFPTIGYGLVHFLFGGMNDINKKLLYGGLDTYMTQPKSVYFNLLTSRSDISAFGDFLYGTILAIYVSNSILKFLEILFFGILSGIILLVTMTIVRSLSVWLGDLEDTADKYEHSFLINFSVYPEVIFGNITKFILYTIVPVGYMAYIPIRLLKEFDMKLLVVLIGIVIAETIVATIIFRKALEKYESGNAISLKE